MIHDTARPSEFLTRQCRVPPQFENQQYSDQNDAEGKDQRNKMRDFISEPEPLSFFVNA